MTKTINTEVKAIDLSDLDLSINPAEDFDNYANGGWKKKNPIPDDKSRFGTFDKLRDAAEKQVQQLFENLLMNKFEEGSNGRKISNLYKTGMDIDKIETQNYQPILPYLNQINALNSIEEIQNFIYQSHAIGNGILFSFFSSADRKNSSFVIGQFYQSGMGLSDRDYYLEEDHRSIEIREKYTEHISKMFQLIDYDEGDAKVIAHKLMDIETQLAKASLSRIEQRNPERTYHKTNVEGLKEIAPNFNWSQFFQTIEIAEPGEFNIGMPDFMTAISDMMKTISIDDWKLYLKWDILNGSASYLSDKFVQQNFDFYGKTMQGQKEIRERWKRIQGTTNAVLGEAVGQLYVEKFFPPEAKERMLNLVENLKIAFGERIQQLDWMSDETKTKALQKLETIKVKIGYPDKWRDYSTLKIKTDSYFANIIRARAFGARRIFNKINKPVDRDEWFMTPQTVNAYYHPLFNEIAFPAAILQSPFFFLNGDDAVNYGAIGVVIGHEMTHGFDDQGRKYDKEGNMNNWWTESDKAQFEERTQILINQFNNFEVSDKVKANGELTLGENIADLGGLNIALQAFKNGGKETEPIDGFTSIQRFFISYAHLWASNIREEEKLRLTKEDVHSLGRNRVMGPLKNMKEFHEAFNISESDFMYLSEKEQAIIW